MVEPKKAQGAPGTQGIPREPKGTDDMLLRGWKGEPKGAKGNPKGFQRESVAAYLFLRPSRISVFVK